MPSDQTALSLESAPAGHLRVSALEQWLWSAACVIRRATDAPKFKGFILPLVFLSPSQFVVVEEKATHRPHSGILAELDDAKAERERADAHLAATLARLGLVGGEAA